MITVVRDERLPGAALDDFARLVDALTALVDHVGEEVFRSFYTLVPLATQTLGIDTPLFGSGRSPFSMVSLLPKVRDPRVVAWKFSWSIEQCRELIDELYDMAAPILLGQEETYIALQADVVYSDRFTSSADADAYRQVLREKFARLGPVVRRLRHSGPGQVVHIAHYGYAGDLRREHATVKSLPPERFERWCRDAFPTVFELSFHGFSGPTPDVRVWIVVVNNSTEQLLGDIQLRREKILQSARLAEQLGAQTVGMGGLVASFANGGQLLAESFAGMGFTTGHAFTIANILEIARKAAERSALDWSSSTTAVVGAGGSIGSGCAQLLARRGPRRMVLVDVPGQQMLAQVAAAVRRVNPAIQVVCSHRLADIAASDLTIVATNWPGSLVQPQHLKPGSIIIDDSFPKNVSETLARDRTDIIPLEGGILRLPFGVEVDRARNVPNLLDVPLTRMVSCREVYGCLAETLTLGATSHAGNYGLGRSDPGLADDIWRRAAEIGFTVAPLQFFGEAITEARFERARAARAEAAAR